MNPALLLALLVAGLLALLPLWSLRRAGWPGSWLQTAWVVVAALIFLAVRVPTMGRLLLPVILVLFVAPFVLGPDRLARLAGRRRGDGGGIVIDVTPRTREPGSDTPPGDPPAAP